MRASVSVVARRLNSRIIWLIGRWPCGSRQTCVMDLDKGLDMPGGPAGGWGGRYPSATCYQPRARRRSDSQTMNPVRGTMACGRRPGPSATTRRRAYGGPPAGSGAAGGWAKVDAM